MKKALLLLLTTLLFFTAACSGGSGSTTAGKYPTDDTYHPETDHPYYMSAITGYVSVARAQNGYYFMLDNTLLYADVDTMEPIPVCAKPNCRHHEETDMAKQQACSAYFPRQSASSVFVSNGQLYVFHSTFGLNLAGKAPEISGYALTKVSFDGSVRETLLTFENAQMVLQLIHRGRFYMVVQTTDEQGYSTYEIRSYSLDNPNEEPKVLYRSQPIALSHSVVQNFYAYGMRLYVKEELADTDDWQNLVLRICDLNTGEWTVIVNPEGYRMGPSSIAAGKLVCAYWPIGISAMYNAGEDVPNLAAPMISYALDGSDAQELAFESWGTMMADANYIYLVSPRITQLHADGSYTISTPTDSLYFCDPEMNLVDELPLERIARPGGTLTGYMIFPLEGGNVLLYARYQDGMAFYSIDRDQIGSGEITPTVFLEYDFGEYSIAG